MTLYPLQRNNNGNDNKNNTSGSSTDSINSHNWKNSTNQYDVGLTVNKLLHVFVPCPVWSEHAMDIQQRIATVNVIRSFQTHLNNLVTLTRLHRPTN